MKRKLVSLLLCTVMVLACFAFVPASAAASETATRTNATVLVNGTKKTFDAYNIKGNNYFKLRDIAFVLTGTEKTVSVAWDGEKNAIALTTGKIYIPVGGEMTIPEAPATRTATVTTASVTLDGEAISSAAYNIGGNNYFKLRDLGAAINFGVDWNAASSTIEISSKKGYTPEGTGTTPTPVNELYEIKWDSNDVMKVSTGNGGKYPRLTTLANGDIMGVFRDAAYLKIRTSSTEGKTWTTPSGAAIQTITPSIYADKNEFNCFGYDVTNPEIFTMKDGTVLISYRCNQTPSSVSNSAYSSIRIMQSKDNGVTWSFHSTPIENMSVVSSGAPGGFYEPFICYIDDDNNDATPDKMAVYYCSDTRNVSKPSKNFLMNGESILTEGTTIEDYYGAKLPLVTSSNYQHVLVQVWDDATGKWGAPQIAMDGEEHNSRDGMETIAKLSDGNYVMATETNRYLNAAVISPDGLKHRLAIQLSFSQNGLKWSAPKTVFLPAGNGPDGQPSYAGAPYVVALPDGRIAVSCQTNENYTQGTIVTSAEAGLYNCVQKVIISKEPVTYESRTTISADSFGDATIPQFMETNGYSNWASLFVYKDKYLFAVASTGINVSDSKREARPCKIRRAPLAAEYAID